MDAAAGGFGWVNEGDKAPCFELPDSSFTSVSPIEGHKKVRGSGGHHRMKGSDLHDACQVRA